MVPGYAIIPPADFTEDGATVFGSYAVVNPWPQKLSEQRTLYLNQFTGQTIANATSAEDGDLSRATSFGIAMHMGTQYGVLTRISATVACVGVLMSVLTGLLMWWRRRPAGGSGLPTRGGVATRAPLPKRAVTVAVAGAVVLGVVFPVFGVSLLLVLGVELVLSRRDRTSDDDAGEAVVPDGALEEAQTEPAESGAHV